MKRIVNGGLAEDGREARVNGEEGKLIVYGMVAAQGRQKLRVRAGRDQAPP